VKYKLSTKEQKRLIKGLKAAMATFFVDCIEDFIWEAIFAYAKCIDYDDPLDNIRAKLLFDVVDENTRIGWSAKTQQLPNIQPSGRFELVIQRADIFTKAQELGFSYLSINSSVDDLGLALLRHWHKKIQDDSSIQRVDEKRVCILLKDKNNMTFGYFEDDLAIYKPKEIFWEWTNSEKKGLKGFRKSDGELIYRWYPNQKQFFERFIIHKEIQIFHIEHKRIPQALVLDTLINLVDNQE